MRVLAAALLTVLIPASSLAQTTPPADGEAAASATAATAATPAGSMMKLSDVIAALETRVGADLDRVEEVDWDDDGYWEIEYRTTNGSETEVKIDPATGDPRS